MKCDVLYPSYSKICVVGDKATNLLAGVTCILWKQFKQGICRGSSLIQASLLGHYLVKMVDQRAGHVRYFHLDGNVADRDNSSGAEQLSDLFSMLAYYETFDKRMLLNCFSERFLFTSCQRLTFPFSWLSLSLSS